ncbi:hypothetical protein [Microbispora triticiradicis]|uniref:hypothetical protein n=1 Tax=Microbispora triticiradicis TaxID=2200763 RepID=UPI001AD6C571|nr:hypothetical protein [Microbispora triticiradicis]MBO4275164.1 hypothetical protein [Microbispora triticiradicis]
MGLFGDKRQAKEASAAHWDAAADKYAARAREQAKKAEARRKSLASGKSQDPAADRYLLEQAERHRRICEANVKDCRDMAKASRKRWV